MSFNKLKLGTQLTFVFVFVFLIIISLLGVYYYNLQIKNIKSNQENSVNAISKSIAAAISVDIYTDNYSAIENKLLALDEIQIIQKDIIK